MTPSKRGALGPKASNWDKISARSSGETLTNRDVYGDQQLDRGKLRSVLGPTAVRFPADGLRAMRDRAAAEPAVRLRAA